MAAGRALRGPGRRRAVDAPAADSRAARGAVRHDPRPGFPRSIRTDTRRDPPRLPGAGAADHARRADGRHRPIPVTRQHGSRAAWCGRANRSSVCLPARRLAAPGRPRQSGPILFVGTLEPRKNVHRLARTPTRCSLASPAAIPDAVLAGAFEAAGTRPLHRPGLAARAPSTGRLTGYVTDEERRACIGRRRCWCCPRSKRDSAFPALEAMTVGVPVVAAARGAARSGRRRRDARRS